MSTTSSASAKAIPKPERKPVSNGTPRKSTVPKPVNGSPTATVWCLTMENGDLYDLAVPGNGRISFGGTRGNHEVRVYETATSKHYCAVITGVAAVVRNDLVLKDRSRKPKASKATYAPVYTMEALAEEIVSRVADREAPEVSPW